MYKVSIINDGEEKVIHHPSINELKVTSGQIKTGINVAASFTFTLLPNNPGFSLIRPLKTLINVKNLKTGKMEFEGRVLSPKVSMDEGGKFINSYVCESELGYLNDSTQSFSQLGTNPSPSTILAKILYHHNRDVKDDFHDKSFRVGIVEVEDSTVALDSFLEYDGTFDTIDSKLLKVLGGELQVRKENEIRYLDYLKSIGEVKKTEIRIAKNLKTIQQEIDPSAVITRLVPLGKEQESNQNNSEDSNPRLTISEVNDGLDYIEDTQARNAFGIVTKTQVWDDVDNPNILKAIGRSFLAKNNRVKKKTILTALDLSLLGIDPDQYEVGNYHPIINPVMGINETLRIVEKTTDIINPNQNTLAVGDTFKTSSKYLSEANKVQGNIEKITSTVTRQSNQIFSISSDLSTTKQELDLTKQTLESYQSSTGTNISEVNEQIRTLLGVVEDLQLSITDIESIVSVEQIQSMQQGINNNTEGITTIDEKMVIINQTLESLNQRVANLEHPPTEGGTV